MKGGGEEVHRLVGMEKGKARGTKGNGASGRLGGDDAEDNSAMFSAAFTAGAVETTLMADQGSPVSIMPPDVLSALGGVAKTVVELSNPRSYSMILTGAARLTTTKQVTADVELLLDVAQSCYCVMLFGICPMSLQITS